MSVDIPGSRGDLLTSGADPLLEEGCEGLDGRDQVVAHPKTCAQVTVFNRQGIRCKDSECSVLVLTLIVTLRDSLGGGGAVLHRSDWLPLGGRWRRFPLDRGPVGSGEPTGHGGAALLLGLGTPQSGGYGCLPGGGKRGPSDGATPGLLRGPKKCLQRDKLGFMHLFTLEGK